LEDKGYDKAYVLLGQFLLFKKNEELFKKWLMSDIEMNSRYAKNCYDCLKEWCLSFI
jgi:hypothetical protein